MSNPVILRREFIFSCLAGVCLPSAWAFEPVKKESSSFSFVFVSDCHLAAGKTDNFMLLQESQLFLQDIVKQINAINPDFVIFGGDQVQGVGDDDTNWQLFLDIVQGLNCSWYFVLGESDVSGNYAFNKMRTYGRDWRGRGLDNDKPYWSCNPFSQLHLIGLDSSSFNFMSGQIGLEQFEWLKEDIAKEAKALNILISHRPLLAPAYADGSDNLIFLEAKKIREILAQSKRKFLVLSGHSHANKIVCQDEVLYISNSSLDIYPCAFRYITVQEDTVTVESHQVSFPALIKKARVNLLNSNLASSYNSSHPDKFIRLILGDKLDQNASISLKTKEISSLNKKSSFIQ